MTDNPDFEIDEPDEPTSYTSAPVEVGEQDVLEEGDDD